MALAWIWPVLFVERVMVIVERVMAIAAAVAVEKAVEQAVVRTLAGQVVAVAVAVVIVVALLVAFEVVVVVVLVVVRVAVAALKIEVMERGCFRFVLDFGVIAVVDVVMERKRDTLEVAVAVVNVVA